LLLRSAAGRSRQRRGGVVLRAQEGDDVGPLLRIGNAWEGHHRPWRKGLRIGDPGVEQLVGPNAVFLMRLQGVGVVEALYRGDLPPDHAVEVGPDQRRAALIEGVTDFAYAHVGLALLRVG